MKTLILASLALAAAFAVAAQAQTVTVQGAPAPSGVVVEPAPGATVTPGPTVVTPGAAVIEERGPYDAKPELNTQSRERTPNRGDGTTRTKDANDG